MKKSISMTLILMLLISMTLSVFSGCGGAAASSGGSGGKILFSLSDASDKFRGILGNAAADYAKSNGISLTMVDEKNSLESQLKTIAGAKSDGYSAIICNLIDTDTAQQMIAAADGLPIIFINTRPQESVLEPDKYIYVGSNEEMSAKLQAQFLTTYFKGKGKTKFNAVLFEGELTHPAAITRTEVVKQELKKAGLEVTYVFQDTAKWSRDTSKSMFEFFLKTGAQYDAVICNNDEMALGVVAACKEKGIDPSSIPIIGIDGTSDACNAIKEGSMAFSVLQSAAGQGKSAVESALKLMNGQSISGIQYASDDRLYIWIPFEAINPDNVADYLK